MILERGDSIAPAWRERWDSLTLFTPRRYSALPGLPFPGDPDGYPTRDEVIAYLERYAETLRAPDRAQQRGAQARADEDGRFVLERRRADDHRRPGRGRDRARSRRRTSRSSPSELDPERLPGAQHAATGGRATCPPGTVLVVGGGNTGFQIAKELSATHKVLLSVGSRQKPLPQRLARPRPLLVADEDAA